VLALFFAPSSVRDNTVVITSHVDLSCLLTVAYPYHRLLVSSLSHVCPSICLRLWCTPDALRVDGRIRCITRHPHRARR